MWKFLIPIKHNYYIGNGDKIAICTLSSIKLLLAISNDTKLMNNIAIVGRLFSENKGIDRIIQYCLANRHLAHLVVCGTEVSGHLAGDSLIALFSYGITREGKIVNSKSPHPQLVSSFNEVQTFRNRITIHNLIEMTDLSKIKYHVDRLI